MQDLKKFIWLSWQYLKPIQIAGEPRWWSSPQEPQAPASQILDRLACFEDAIAE